MGVKREDKKYDEHKFHSSVNRIPRLPDYARKNDSANDEAIYQEGIQTYLDHLHSDRLSGYFDLQLTAHSPLLIGEQTTEEGIHYLQIQEVDGKPFIAPTMIKGLLSTAYERITSSRFRIFDVKTHSAPLTYRTQPDQALSLVPVRCTYAPPREDANGQYEFERLDGGGNNDNKPAFIPIQDSPALDDSKTIEGNKHTLGYFKPNKNNGKRLAKYFKTHDEVRFEAYRIKNRWIVSKISKVDGSSELILGTYEHSEESKTQELKTAHTFTGFLYITTPHKQLVENTTNFGTKRGKRKWAERIFIQRDKDSNSTYNTLAKKLLCSRSTIDSYLTVLGSYQTEQDIADSRNKRSKRNTKGKKGTQSKRRKPNIDKEEPPRRSNIFTSGEITEETFTKGRLAYAIIDSNDTISELIPISVGRHAYSHSPLDIAEHDNVRPAKSLGEASAADRLFGFVGSNGDNVTALRGRIQVSPVSISENPIAQPSKEEEYKLLPPLLSPKPSSGRRFLVSRKDFPNPTKDSKRTGTCSNQSQSILSRSTLFDPSNSSLGEAAYPTHRSCIGQPLDKIIEKFSTSGGDLKTNESLQLHVRSWIKEGSILSCRVHFEDVSPKELAFLLWPLIPKNLSPEGCSEIGYHKLGIGKPLGFGLIEVKIADKFVHFQEPADISGGYSKLTTVLGSQFKPAKAAQVIKDGNIGDLTCLPSVRAFQRIAYGFANETSASNGDVRPVPVRYINLDENKVNNATDSNGDPLFFKMHGCHAGRAPQALWIQSGAEQPDVFLADKKSDHRNNSRQGRTRDDTTRGRADKQDIPQNKRDKRSDSHHKQSGLCSSKTQNDIPESSRKQRRRRRSRKR
jgi:CRISPR-associated protein